MAVGFPTKVSYANGDVFSASDINDTNGTINLIKPTAKGDIFVGSAANTYTKLSVGTDNQVLVADSTTATGTKWSTINFGAFTLLSTTTLSGTTTISSINQSYTSLMIFIYGVTNSTGNANFRCAPNGSTNITDQINALTSTISTRIGDYLLPTCGAASPGQSLYTDSTNSFSITIDNYSSTTSRKTFSVAGGYVDTSSTRKAVMGAGLINTTSAITSLVFDTSANSLNGGTVLLYGVK